MNQMRYNLTGSRLICPGCVEKERSAIKPGTTHSISPRTGTFTHERSQTSAAPGQAENEEMTGYYCRSCRFKFSRKKGFDATSCPYCGRQTVSEAYKGNAQDLIEDSARSEDDF